MALYSIRGEYKPAVLLQLQLLSIQCKEAQCVVSCSRGTSAEVVETEQYIVSHMDL